MDDIVYLRSCWICNMIHMTTNSNNLPGYNDSLIPIIPMKELKHRIYAIKAMKVSYTVLLEIRGGQDE